MKNIILMSINKTFGQTRVLDNFSYTFQESGRVAVMGPSGVGKTTLIRIMMGLEKPDAGAISGVENERFSCVFQEDRLFESFSAVENIAAVFDIAIPREAIIEELKGVGLGEEKGLSEKILCGSPVSDFSGGMKRRVAIVRAMMADSDTVILDEPFKGLDADLKKEVINYVEDRLGARRLILITHDEAEAEALCDETLIMDF